MPEVDILDVDLDRMSEEEVMDLIKAALERLTPARLSEVIEAVEAKRRAREAEAKETLLAEFRERAMQMRLSFDAMFGARRMRSDAGQSLAPRYRGPGGETWSGRGGSRDGLPSLRQRENF